MKHRGKWQGMTTIAQFNWPFYATASVLWCASLGGLFLLSRPSWRLLFAIILAGTTYFLFGSLAVSHFIYDRSELYRWSWLDRALSGVPMDQALLCHSGFDEVSAELREKFKGVQWQVLDHFDQRCMTEPSIRRARAMFPPIPGTLPTPHYAWSVAAGSADVILGILAIHELRTEAERSAWFAESRRCLRENGRVVLVEHMRDPANFLAFGPGFLHFHSPASWRRCWEHAGFTAIDEFRITPFVRAFVLAAR